MLVIDGVELESVDQIAEVRNLDDDASAFSGELAQRRNEATKVGNMGEDVVRHHEIGRTAFSKDRLRESLIQKLRDRLDASRSRDRGDVLRGFDTQRRN